MGACGRDRLYLDCLPTPVFFKDLKGRYTECNRAFCDLVGIRREEIIGKRAEDIGQGSFTRIYDRADAVLLEGGGTQVYEVAIPHPLGGVRQVQIMKDLVSDPDTKAPLGFSAVAVDVTERNRLALRMKRFAQMKDIAIEINRDIMQAEDRSDIVDRLLEKCLSSIPSANIGAVLVLDEDGWLTIPSAEGYGDDKIKRFRIRLEDSFAWNQAKGIPEKTLVVEDIDRLCKDAKFPELLLIDGETVKTSLVSPIRINGVFYGFINADSTRRNAFDEDDIEIMEYMRDQIQIALSGQALYREKLMLMRTDQVTGSFNRRYFEELAEKNLQLVKDSGQEASLALLDIDRMKHINDAYGHPAGDLVLYAFADRMKKAVRGCDILGRYGGDEFAVFFPGSGKSTITEKMEELRRDMETRPVYYRGRPIPLLFSFGVAEYGTDGRTYPDLVRRADEAMYRDKKARRLHA